MKPVGFLFKWHLNHRRVWCKKKKKARSPPSTPPLPLDFPPPLPLLARDKSLPCLGLCVEWWFHQMSTQLWHVWVSRCLLFRLKHPFSQISVCLGKYTTHQLRAGATGERYNIPWDWNMNCFLSGYNFPVVFGFVWSQLRESDRAGLLWAEPGRANARSHQHCGLWIAASSRTQEEERKGKAKVNDPALVTGRGEVFGRSCSLCGGRPTRTNAGRRSQREGDSFPLHSKRWGRGGGGNTSHWEPQGFQGSCVDLWNAVDKPCKWSHGTIPHVSLWPSQINRLRTWARAPRSHVWQTCAGLSGSIHLWCVHAGVNSSEVQINSSPHNPPTSSLWKGTRGGEGVGRHTTKAKHISCLHWIAAFLQPH